MSTFERVDLPSGGWAELRDPETITPRMRRPVQRVQMRLGFDADLQALVRYQVRVQRELTNAQKAAADAGTEFDVEDFEPKTLAPQVRQADLNDEQLDLLTDLTEAVTAVLVEAWSFAPPVSASALQDLPQKDYEALLDAASKYRDALLPSFDVDPAPESPTAPSGESETP